MSGDEFEALAAHTLKMLDANPSHRQLVLVGVLMVTYSDGFKAFYDAEMAFRAKAGKQTLVQPL